MESKLKKYNFAEFPICGTNFKGNPKNVKDVLQYIENEMTDIFLKDPRNIEKKDRLQIVNLNIMGNHFFIIFYHFLVALYVCVTY